MSKKLLILLCIFFFYSNCLLSQETIKPEQIKSIVEKFKKDKNGKKEKVEKKEVEGEKDEDKDEEGVELEKEKKTESLVSKEEIEFSSLEKFYTENITFKISKNIRQFGYDIFQKSFTTFSPVENIPVGSDYILGPGDALVIYIWGKLVQDIFNVTVDRDGKIILPKVGTLNIWGLKFSQADNLIKKALQQYYTNIQIEITVGKLRTMNIFILGEVKKPGAYTISSLSTVLHSLYESGGPTKLGSLRQIKLIRNGKVFDNIDLYPLLINGDKRQDHRLQSNDTIFVPIIGKVVGICGNVKKPSIYELVEEKTKISDLIEMAGGISPAGYVNMIQIERIKDHEKKIILDIENISLTQLKDDPVKNIDLQDGDLVYVFSILTLRYNYVSITGNVRRPGDYELKPGMRIKDLIDKANGIELGTYFERAEIRRYKDDKTREIISFHLGRLLENDDKENFPLKEWDEVVIYSNTDVLSVSYVYIDGAVYKPDKYELTPNMKISDLIFLVGGLKKTASLSNAELFRIIPTKKVMKIDLKKIIENYSLKDDLILQEDDHLFIRETKESISKKIIKITGELRYPGIYIADDNEKLSSVIKRAGGFTSSAFLNGAIFIRESVKVLQQKTINKFIEIEQKSLLSQQSLLSKPGISEAEIKQSQIIIQQKQELLKSLSSLEVPGRIIIKLDELDKLSDSKDDMMLEDGDIIHIPSFPSTVQVLGSVYNPSSLLYTSNKNISYYLEKVGGPTKTADINVIYIIKSNGEAEGNINMSQKIEVGDTVVVPEKIEIPSDWVKTLLDITTIIYHIAVGAAVLLK